MAFKNWLEKKGQQYKEYRAKAPEREAAKMERMKQQTKMLKAKTELVHQRGKLQKARQASMPKMPEGFGSGGFGFGMPSMPDKRRKRKY